MFLRELKKQMRISPQRQREFWLRRSPNSAANTGSMQTNQYNMALKWLRAKSTLQRTSAQHECAWQAQLPVMFFDCHRVSQIATCVGEPWELVSLPRRSRASARRWLCRSTLHKCSVSSVALRLHAPWSLRHAASWRGATCTHAHDMHGTLRGTYRIWQVMW